MFRKTLLLIVALMLLCLNPLLADGANVGFLLSGLTQLGGGVVTSGWVYAYAAGTTNLKTLYSDAALTTALDNPVQLDTAGRLIAYGSGQYKFVVKDQYFNTLFTVDNVEVESLASLLTDASDPFGANLSQTNLLVTNAILASATITDLAVLNGITLSNLSVNNTPISGVATATQGTEASNLGQVQALLASAIAEGIMQADGSNASITQDISMVNHKLTNVATGTEAQDAVNKGQMDSALASFTPETSGLMNVSGSNAAIAQDISMVNHKLTNVATGTEAQDAVNKGQMDAAIAGITPGTIDHSGLTNLSYDLSDHTGFARETGSSTVTFSAAGLTLAGETMTRISNIRTAAPTTPKDGDIWIDEP